MGGRWYYEAVVLTGGTMRVGWADSMYRAPSDNVGGAGADNGNMGTMGSLAPPSLTTPSGLRGIGDHPHSWAYDGSCGQKMNGVAGDYGGGARWRPGDVIGCLLDLSETEGGTAGASIGGMNVGGARGAVEGAGGGSGAGERAPAAAAAPK